MKTIVLAYSGGVASSNAIHWLTETCVVDVVTMTLDVGQGEDLAVLRSRALACGARRAHAIDARDELVREFLLPSLGGGQFEEGSYPLIAELAHPLIARKLLEVAGIEGTSVVAHGSANESIDVSIRALDSNVDILAPAREWKMNAAQQSTYSRARGVPSSLPSDKDRRVEQNLWGRMVSVRNDGERREPQAIVASREPAHVDICFENGVPIAINEVPMAPVELIESLALIAGRHGIGRLERNRHEHTIVYDVPAAIVLHAARAAIGGRNGVAHLALLNGTCTVRDLDTEMVNLA
jgi:argininosuccinate synthase